MGHFPPILRISNGLFHRRGTRTHSRKGSALPKAKYGRPFVGPAAIPAKTILVHSDFWPGFIGSGAGDHKDPVKYAATVSKSFR